MIHRRITRYEFNLAMGWCGDEPDTEEGRKKVLEKVLAKYESRIEDGDPINPS